MASSLTIKANIDSILVRNGNKNITGPILHDVVKSILDADIRTTGKITDHINSPSQGTLSADFFTRHFYDSVGRISVDYGNRKLYRVDGTYFDWNGGVGSGSVTSVELISTDFLIASTSNPITSAGSWTINIKPKAVTYNKIQDTASGQVLLGRANATNGTIAEIFIGSGLALDPVTGVLSASTTSASQINIPVHNVDTTLGTSTLMGTTKTGHGYFVPTRVMWLSKTAVPAVGPAPNEGTFSITWPGGAMMPIGLVNFPTVSITDRTGWADLLQQQMAIPPNTAITLNMVTTSTGYTSHLMDVYIIGFYEIP